MSSQLSSTSKKLRFVMPSQLSSASKKTHTLVLDLDQTLVHSTKTGLRWRPYVQKFLKRVAEIFNVVIFTAAQKDYADGVLNQLDPENKLISRRLYNDSCSHLSNGNYVKDLDVLGLDLAKVVFVDNDPTNFMLQQRNNGIPIETWIEDPFDRELILLLPVLETLVHADDVRPIIKKRFWCRRK